MTTETKRPYSNPRIECFLRSVKAHSSDWEKAKDSEYLPKNTRAIRRCVGDNNVKSARTRLKDKQLAIFHRSKNPHRPPTMGKWRILPDDSKPKAMANLTWLTEVAYDIESRGKHVCREIENEEGCAIVEKSKTKGYETQSEEEEDDDETGPPQQQKVPSVPPMRQKAIAAEDTIAKQLTHEAKILLKRKNTVPPLPEDDEYIVSTSEIVAPMATDLDALVAAVSEDLGTMAERVSGLVMIFQANSDLELELAKKTMEASTKTNESAKAMTTAVCAFISRVEEEHKEKRVKKEADEKEERLKAKVTALAKEVALWDEERKQKK